MQSFGPNRKAEAESRPTVKCPRCGQLAVERRTRYGIRSECCGLHSWDRSPLVDQTTHDARKKLNALAHDLKRTLGTAKLATEIDRRAKVPYSVVSDIQTMNEATAKKIIKAMEDVLVDIMAGSIDLR